LLRRDRQQLLLRLKGRRIIDPENIKVELIQRSRSPNRSKPLVDPA
jgi:hypothetical protein